MSSPRYHNANTAMIVTRALQDVEVSTITTYGKGLTDYVRVFMPTEYNGKPTITEITWHVSEIIGGRKLIPGKGIPVSGGNFNKALHVLDAAARSLCLSFDQGAWREL